MTGPNFSTPQSDVINALRACGPCTVSKLVEVTGRNVQSVKRAVKSLSTAGFIEVVGKESVHNVDARVWGVVQ